MFPHSRSSILSQNSGHKGSHISGCLFHLCILLSLLSKGERTSLAKHLFTHAMNQMRELICIKTNQKEAWPAFTFPAHYMAVQNLGLAQGEMKGERLSLCGSAALCYLQIFQELHC